MVDTVFILVSAACHPERIAPAADQFARSGKTATLVKLLLEAQNRLRQIPAADNPFKIGEQGFDPIQDHLDVIEGREFYRPSTNHQPPRPNSKTSKADLKTYVEEQVYPSLFLGLCVAYQSGVAPRQVLTRGRLLPYLYEHSMYFEEVFTGALTGKPLTWLPSIEQLTTEDLMKLSEHLDAVPIPDDAEEQRKAREKWEAMVGDGRGVFVSSEFADVYGEPPSVQLRELKQLLQLVISRPDLVIMQQYQ